MTQVTLVPDEHDDYVGVSVVPQLLQPTLHVLVGHVLGYVVNKEGTYCTAIVPREEEEIVTVVQTVDEWVLCVCACEREKCVCVLTQK